MVCKIRFPRKPLKMFAQLLRRYLACSHGNVTIGTHRHMTDHVTPRVSQSHLLTEAGSAAPPGGVAVKLTVKGSAQSPFYTTLCKQWTRWKLYECKLTNLSSEYPSSNFGVTLTTVHLSKINHNFYPSYSQTIVAEENVFFPSFVVIPHQSSGGHFKIFRVH